MKSSRFVLLLLLALFSCGKPVPEDPGQAQSGTTEPDPAEPDPIEKSLLDFAAYKSGDNWGPALQQACKECQRIHIPAGTYRMSAVRVASDTEITGEGEATVIIPTSTILFRVEGLADEPVTIGADIPDFSNILTLSREAGFQKGDMLILQSQRNCMFREDCGDWTLGQTESKGRTCFFGEIREVAAAEGARITLTENLQFPFYKANATGETVKDGFEARGATTAMRVVPAEHVTIRNLSVKNIPKCLEIIRFKYARHCSASDITALSEERYDGESLLQFFKTNLAADCHFYRCHSRFSGAAAAQVKDLGRVYANYSIFNTFRLISSDRCSFEECSDNAASHAFSVTYGNGSIPSVHCKVTGCRSENSVWAGVVSQQCTPWTELSGNTVTGSSQGIFAGSRFSVIRGNTVTTTLPYDTDHYYAHLSRGGTTGIAVFEGYARGCEIKDNTVIGFRTGIAVMDGYEKNNIFDGPADLTVSGNRVRDCFNGFKVVRNSYNKAAVDLAATLTGNEFHAAAEAAATGIGIDRGGAVGITLSDNSLTGFATEIKP